MDMIITTCASVVCFDPYLNIANLSDREPTPEIEWPELTVRPYGIDMESIVISQADRNYYLSEAEQRVFARTLLRSVSVLDEGSLIR